MLTKSFIMSDHEAAQAAVSRGLWYSEQTRAKKHSMGSPHLQKAGSYLHKLMEDEKTTADKIGLTTLVEACTEPVMLLEHLEYFVCKKCIQPDGDGNMRVIINYRTSTSQMHGVMEQIRKDIWEKKYRATEAHGGPPPTKSERKMQAYPKQLKKNWDMDE